MLYYMKTKLVYFTFCLLIAISCGSAKKAVEAENEYQAYEMNQPVPPPLTADNNYQEEDDGEFVEVVLSPIEELSLATNTNEIRAFGQAESMNEQLALNAARAQAIAALQEKIEVYVQAGLDRYVQETNNNGVYSIDESVKSQVVTAAKGTVSGATVLDSRKLYNPKTKRYKYEVCVKYDREGIITTMQKQNDKIAANEKKFEADMIQAWNYLDEQNNRQKSRKKSIKQGDDVQINYSKQEQINLQILRNNNGSQGKSN